MLWQEKLASVLAPFEITQTQYAIMASLRWFEEQREPPTQSHLVAHTKIDKMTLSKAIRRLEQQGYVARFTGEGRRTISRAVEAIENADDDFFGGLRGSDLDSDKQLTRALIAHQG